jgi:DNA-binding NtrC family response regulator
MESDQTIWVIDDEIGPRSALRACLEDHFQVETFADGLSALTAAATSSLGNVCAAFVDHAMPQMAGDELCGRLREIDPYISLIGFSGNEQANFNCSLFAFLTKNTANRDQILAGARQATDETRRRRSTRDPFPPR